MKNKFALNICLLLTLCFGFSFNNYAQQVVVGTGTTTTLNAPISIVGSQPKKYSRSASIYTAAEIISAGGYAGTINKIAWHRASLAGALHKNNNGRLKVYIKHISTSTIDSSNKSWAPLQNNSTLVYFDTTVNFGATSGWKELNLTNKFIWNGIDNLLVLVDWENPDTAQNNLQWRTTIVTNSMAFRTNSSFAVMSTVQRFSDRPNIRFTFSRGLNDAGLKDLNIQIGRCAGDSVAMTCKVENNSNGFISSFKLAMTVNGVSRFIKTFSANLRSASDTIIDLGKTVFSSTNTDNIKLWIYDVNNLADQVNTNDTIKKIASGYALSGTYSVGPNGDFTSVAAVVNALNTRGICSNVVFNFDSSAGPYTGIHHLYNFNPNSNYSVIWNGNGSVINATVALSTSTYNQQSFLYLHSVKNFKIERFNFDYTQLNTTGSCIRILDSCENIDIKRNTFYHQNFNHGVSIVINGNSEVNYAILVKVNNINIENNTFSRGKEFLEVFGVVNYPLNITIKNNKIIDPSTYGMYLYQASAVQVLSNEIYCTQKYNSMASGLSGIMVYGASTELKIEKNRIHDLAITSSATSYSTVMSIYLSNANNVSITNNLIYNVTNPEATFYGIYCNNSSLIQVDYNTISSGSKSLQTGLFYGIAIVQSSKYKIRNNIFQYNSISNAKRIAIGLNPMIDSLSICDYNLYHIKGSGSGTDQIANVGLGNYLTLAAWKAINPGKHDVSSIEGDPVLINVSAGNLISNSVLANNTATPIANLLDDINGTTRSATTPDIGAYEFTPIPLDAQFQSVFVPTTECGSPQVVKINFRNIGTQQIDSIEFKWMVNGVMQPSKKFIATIAVGVDQQLVIGTYPMVYGNNYNIKAWVYKVNGISDNNLLNDTANSQTTYVVISGTIKVGGPGADFPTLTSALQTITNIGICSTVTLEVNPNYGPYNEQVIINPIAGLSPQSRLIINGNGSEFITNIVGATNNFVFRLNGVSYVTIDGFVIRTNQSNAYGYGIHLKSNSNYNNITNNKIYLTKTSSNSQAGIFFNAGDNNFVSSGNYRGNLIEGNFIDGGTTSIKLYGTPNSKIDDSETIIRKNTLVDFLSTSIQLYEMDSFWVYENEFYQTEQINNAIAVPKAVYLEITSPDKINRIYKNEVHNLVNSKSLSKNIQVFNAIYYAASTVGKDLYIENNIVYNINTAGSFEFFNSQSSIGVRILNNTISVETATARFSFIYSTTYSSMSRHYYYNNIVYFNSPNVILYNNFAANFQGIKSDYNSFYRVGSTTLSFNSSFSLYSSWISAMASDSNSKILVNPNLIASNYILPSKTSNVLAAGKGKQGVLFDFFGNPRSVNNPSIGAVENGSTELTGPSISYSKIPLTSPSKNLVLTNFAYISDTSGIDTNMANRPRLYFKKRTDKNIYLSNTKGTEGWKYVVATNTSSPYSFNIDYKLLKDSSVSGGDFIEFFIYAKDKLGNGSISKYNFNIDLQKRKVIEDILPIKTTFDYYNVGGDLPDTIFVGKQHAIKSLTKEGGLFQLLQNNYRDKMLFVIITSNLDEDGTYTMKSLNRKSAFTPSVLIMPLEDSTYTISSTNNNPVIQLDGADSVTIGSYSSNSRLIFKKINSTFKNLSNVVVINADTLTGPKSDFIDIFNCDFQTVGNAKNSVGVYVGSESSYLNIFNNNFKGNKFGVYCSRNNNFNPSKATNYLNVRKNIFTQDTLCIGVSLFNVRNARVAENIINVGVHDYVPFNGHGYFPSGIKADGYSDITDISSNKIYYNPEQVNQVSFFGINFKDTSGIARRIFNNLIVANYNNAELENVLFGIYLGVTDSVDVVNNSVFFKGSVRNSSTLNNISLEYSKDINIINNSLTNELRYNQGSQALIYLNAASLSNINVDYNQYFTNLKYNSILTNGATRYDSLSKLVAITKSNVHSVFGEINSKEPSFKPSNMLLYGKARKYVLVYEDINGKTRKNKPSIGAFELDSIARDLEIAKIISPENCVDTTNDVEVSLLLKNNGYAKVTSSKIKLIWGDKIGDTLMVSNNTIYEPSSSSIYKFNLPNSTGKLKNNFLKVICLVDSDQVKTNDTALINLNAISGQALQFLYPITDTICKDEPNTIYSNDPLNRNIEWYDSPKGGKLIAVGSNIIYMPKGNDSLYMQVNTEEEVDSLGTGSMTGSSAKGIFVNITNTNSYPIRINQFDIYTQSPNVLFSYSVYGKTGTYNGFENNSAVWNKLTDNLYESTNYNNDKRRAIIKINTPTYILPGQTYAFYVDAVISGTLFSTVNITNSVYNYQKNGVLINYGNVKSFSGFTSSLTSNRKPQMTVYYNRTDKCYISDRVKYSIFVPPNINASIINGTNILMNSGTIINPDIICSNSNAHYQILNPSDRPESEYNVTWRVSYKRFYIVENDKSITLTLDTARRFDIYIPGNVDNNRMYGIDYMLTDLRSNCNTMYTRYVVLLKPQGIDIGSDKEICDGDSVTLRSSLNSPYLKYEWSNGKTDSVITVKTSGKYTLKVYFGNCSVSEDSVRINVKPSYDSLAITQALKDSCRYEFTLNAIPNTTISWDFGDGFTTTGNFATHAYKTNGTYIVRMKFDNSNTCIKQDSASTRVVVTCFTGIDQTRVEDVEIYPNPSSGIFNINTTNKIDKIEVYTIEGKRILTSNVSSIDLSGFSDGIYTARIISNSGVMIRKLVKNSN